MYLAQEKEFVPLSDLSSIHCPIRLSLLVLVGLFFFEMMNDGAGGNPQTAAASSGAVESIPGVLAVVQDPIQFGGQQVPVQIPVHPGFGQVAVQIPGFNQTDGSLQQSMQLVGPQPSEVSAALQVMSPNAGFSGMPMQIDQGQGVPAQATQERLRGVRQDGTAFEAQRVNIVWQNTSTSEQFRGEVTRLNDMLTQTRATQLDREQKIEDFMTNAAERLTQFAEGLTQFAAKVEEEFGKEKTYIQSGIDSWVIQFTDQVITGTRTEIGRVHLDLKENWTPWKIDKTN